MHFLLEAIFVGIYTSIIYVVFHLLFPLIKNESKFFCVGFAKHLLGNYLGLHTYYCNNGYSCKHKKHTTANTTHYNIIIESIAEGILFIVLGRMLSTHKAISPLILFFLIGFILHTICELFGIHNIFCHERCITTN